MCSPAIIKLLSRFIGQNLVFPFYHNVSDKELTHLKFLYKVRSEKEFIKDLEFFLKIYEPIGADELMHRIPDTRKAFHLSFDDGFAENYSVVAPILLKYGIPASFFVSTAFIDNKELMFRCKASILLDALASNPMLIPKAAAILESKPNSVSIREKILVIKYQHRNILEDLALQLNVDFKEYLEKEKPYMTVAQVKELSSKGFTIGAHSVDHPLFEPLALSDQIAQTKDSLEVLHSWIDQKIKLFSFPFEDTGVPLIFFKEIQKEICPPIHLTFGTAGIKNDSLPCHFHRIAMEKQCLGADGILLDQHLRYLLKAPLMRNRMVRN